jgi:hypothetical protein
MSADNRSTSELVADYIERMSRGDVDDGEAGNTILDRIHRGDDIEVLRPLLDAGVLRCTKTLTFILSELGFRSFEAMDWLEVLLDYPDEWVRHYTIVAVWHSGSLVHGEVTAKAISKIGDARAVRLAAVLFLAMGSLRQIATAEPFLEGDLGASVAWLAGGDFDQWQRFSSHGGVAALVAVAAAYRSRAEGDPAPLERLMQDAREPVGDAARYVAQFRPLPLRGRDILHRIARDSEAPRD